MKKSYASSRAVPIWFDDSTIDRSIAMDIGPVNGVKTLNKEISCAIVNDLMEVSCVW